MSAAESEAERIAGCIGAAYIEALKSGASYRDASRAALAALRAQGVALVPVEPTEAMLDAMGEMHMPFGEMRAAWDGALAASPYAPPECAP